MFIRQIIPKAGFLTLLAKTTVTDFIQTWHIPEYICDELLKFYQINPDLRNKGLVNGGDDWADAKKSMDIAICPTNFNKPFKEYRFFLQKCLEEYIQIYPKVNNLCAFNICEPYNIQHYEKGEGFKREHFERDGYDNISLKRCLVFMTYLNDLDAGGTTFPYQKRTLKAQKGKTVLFPADWTHTHVGQISQTQEKTIVTGWYSYVWDN